MKKIIFYAISFFLGCLVLLLTLEGTTKLIYRITGNYRFGPQDPNGLPQSTPTAKYPSNPADFIKIAVFGGSAADGAGSERPFHAMLKYELEKNFPQKKFYIKSYAERGAPFHRYEAELAKAAIDRYDILLIYAGTNEFLNYIEDTGYFRKPEFKNVRVERHPDINLKDRQDKPQIVLPWLRTKSSFYGLLMRLQNKFITPYFEKNPYTIVTRFQEIAEEAAVPPFAVREFIANYEKDLREIIELAKQKGKQVIVSSEVTDEWSRPFFSFHDKHLSAGDLVQLKKLFNAGLQAFQTRDFAAALGRLSKAQKLDDQVAIVNYWLARSHLALGNKSQAHHFFRRAIDFDGLPNRCIDGIFEAAQRVVKDYDNTRYIDAVGLFQNFLDNGYEQKQLFSDMLHPTLLGNSLLAVNFLCALKQLPALRSQGLSDKCQADIKKLDFRAVANEYRQHLGVQASEEADNAFSSARMNISWASRAYYREDFLDWAGFQLNTFLDKSQKSAHDYAMYYLYQFFIEGQGRQDKVQAAQLINKAFDAEPGFVLYAVNREYLATGEVTHDILGRMGISFSKQENRFKFDQDGR